MAGEGKMNPKHTAVLKALAYEGGHYLPFAPIAEDTGLTIAEVRRSCRALRRMGLAQFASGLWTEDGDMAGAGYSATEAGREALARVDSRP